MASQVSDKSNTLIFLDMNVLNGNMYSSNFQQIDKKAKDLTPPSTTKNFQYYLQKAKSFYFDKNSVSALETLISKVETFSNVHIVITSERWSVASVTELKEDVLSQHSFSKHISHVFPETKNSHFEIDRINYETREKINDYVIQNKQQFKSIVILGKSSKQVPQKCSKYFVEVPVSLSKQQMDLTLEIIKNSVLNRWPTAVVFLNTNVFIDPFSATKKLVDIDNTARKLWPEKKIISPEDYLIAKKRFYEQNGMSRLSDLIETTSSIGKVTIVITSKTSHESMEDEKKILSSITDDNVEVLPCSTLLVDRKSKQIKNWLLENQQKNCIQSVTIFDRYDPDLSKKFPHHFVQVNDLLSRNDCNRALKIINGSSPMPTFPKKLDKVVIILNIEGVLIGDCSDSTLAKKIRSKASELFTAKENFTPLEYRRAATHFFDEEAVANLNSLTQKVSRFAKVQIIISSNWKESGTIYDVLDRMFKQHSFSKYIKGVTPSSFDSDRAERKYGFRLIHTAEQIDYWVRESFERVGFKSLVILNARNSDLSKKYPKYFVPATNFLTKEDVEKACNILEKGHFSPNDFPK